MGSSSNRHVLIVEDDEDARETLSELITSYGHHAEAAANAAEALERARSRHPDVALIDLGLPQVDGCELARQLRDLLNEPCAPATRLVALTGHSDRASRSNASAAGFDAYLVKPVKPAALEALLRL
ncbi:MAG TPA: response regulator [Polyangiaceae bacterium]|nr:response regulator [Polyangiaceae bacterium]